MAGTPAVPTALPAPPDGDHPRRPLTVAVDVTETLTDLRPVAGVSARLGLASGSLDWWFAVLLRDGIALAASGGLARFSDLARAALDEVSAASGTDLGDGAGAQVIEAMGRVPLHPDVVAALDRVAATGVPAYALTNTGAAFAGAPVERLALVAVHPWDTHGAAAAGLVTGWVDRTGRPCPAVFTSPVVRAGDLAGVVAGLLALPEE